MFIIILITIILIILFWYLAQRLHGITHHLEKISQGDLTKTLSSNNKSIFKQFSSNINIFILKIRRFITETATLNDKLIDYCRNLSKDAEDVQIAANKTATEINQIFTVVGMQTSDIVQAEKFIKEIVEENKSIIDNGNSIEDMSYSMTLEIDETNKIYEQLLQRLSSSAQSNEDLAKKTKLLNDKVYTIQSISDAVNDISENTTLLARISL